MGALVTIVAGLPHVTVERRHLGR